MIIYIVKPGDNLIKICNAYHLEKSDIISNNLHITDFSKLIPGTKLKIPFLSKETMDTLEETEGFIRDYYPNYDGKFNGIKKSEPKEEEKVEVIKEENIKTNNEDQLFVKNDVSNENLKEKTIPKTNEREKSKVLNYFNYYGGNIVPNIPKGFIRKI